MLVAVDNNAQMYPRDSLIISHHLTHGSDDHALLFCLHQNDLLTFSYTHIV